MVKSTINNDNQFENQYSQKDVKVIKKERLYKGFFECNKYTIQHKLFTGGWSEEFEREFFERGNAAAILPYDPMTDSVVLIEQFRFGAMQSKQSPWLLELVAGIIEKGETTQALIKREAQEEAGLDILASKFICNYLVSPGGTTEQLDIFIGKVDASNAGGLHGLLDEGEDIRVHVFPRKLAYQWISDGKINNAATIIALQWLELNLNSGFKFD
ncbi:MAG: ADP-ribose diphosphatase [Psychromonas sp.]|nr:ADP-ribose diphosphatase [Psychromonas sp.]